MIDDLFSYHISLDEVLANYQSNGKYFLSVAQAAKCLGLTTAEARYAILFYRLDALLITGEYRIHLNWVKDFSAIPQNAFLDFYNQIAEVEIEGIHDLLFKGKVQPLIKSLDNTGYPVSDVIELLHKDHQFKYETMAADEPEVQDWYDLNALFDWPDSAPVSQWAALLSVNSNQLALELNSSKTSAIGWPEIYDFLVEHEVVNLPCPFLVRKPTAAEQKAPTNDLISNELL